MPPFSSATEKSIQSSLLIYYLAVTRTLLSSQQTARARTAAMEASTAATVTAKPVTSECVDAPLIISDGFNLPFFHPPPLSLTGPCPAAAWWKFRGRPVPHTDTTWSVLFDRQPTDPYRDLSRERSPVKTKRGTLLDTSSLTPPKHYSPLGKCLAGGSRKLQEELPAWNKLRPHPSRGVHLHFHNKKAPHQSTTGCPELMALK